jgi:UDP-GlcNAc:undecaprenyl-phosphate/decaprenyl-phosphate GlcNAc-1-phosphate transferase
MSNMLIHLLLTTILSFTLIKLLIKYSHSLGLVDIPNERSSHCSIIPRGAGVGFVIAMMLGIGIYDMAMLMQYWYVFASIAMVFGIGVLDDIYDTPPKAKFLVMFVAVFLLWGYGICIDSLGVWFGFDIGLMWFALPFTMFALAGFTNALNLIDGLDGLAGSVSIVIVGFFGYIGYVYSNDLMIVLSLFTIASLLGFIVLNYNPAKVFMGDSGSLSLGFIVSILAVLSIEYIHPVVVLYIAAVPILDTLIVMIRRIRRGRSPFSPDKTHVHHILVRAIGSEDEDGKLINGTKRTVWFLVLLQVMFSGIGILIHNSILNIGDNSFMPLIALIGFGVLFLVFYIVFTSMKKNQGINF